MVKAFLVLVLLGCLAVNVESLDCYRCPDCDSTEDMKTVNCTVANSDSPVDIVASSTLPSSTNPSRNTDASTTPTNPENTTKPPVVTFACATVKYEDGEKKEHTDRFCTMKENCTEIETAQAKYKKENCKVCSDDGCNSSAESLKNWTILTLLIIGLNKIFMN